MLVINYGFVKQNFNFWSWEGEDQQIIEKSGFLWAKSLISWGFLKEVVNINLPFQNTLSWNPETGLQSKKKRSYFLVLAKFLTIFYIYEDFDQFSRIWSLHDNRIFFQIDHNLLKYPNFLKFFDKIEIYDILSAIWDLPRGYSFFTLEIACK